jgi:hypothetical protein
MGQRLRSIFELACANARGTARGSEQINAGNEADVGRGDQPDAQDIKGGRASGHVGGAGAVGGAGVFVGLFGLFIGGFNSIEPGEVQRL